MMNNENDNELKVFEEHDFAGILTAALSNDRDTAGGGHFDEKQAKEQLKQALAKQGIVEFTDEEIKAIPKTFKRLIIIQKKRCRLRTHVSGKDTTTYEIRYRRDGYDVSASGKTIELAKANFIEKLKTAQPIAKETGAKMFTVKPSDLLSKWFGNSEKNVRKLFLAARSERNAVIFFDEIEGFAGSRDSDSDSMNRVVGELLTQMQGCTKHIRNFVIMSIDCS